MLRKLTKNLIEIKSITSIIKQKFSVKKLRVDDRLQQTQEIEVFITVKDHKEGFSHTLSFRLISPSKSDIGKISKSVLDKMNNAIVSTTRVNQWRKTSTDVY